MPGPRGTGASLALLSLQIRLSQNRRKGKGKGGASELGNRGQGRPGPTARVVRHLGAAYAALKSWVAAFLCPFPRSHDPEVFLGARTEPAVPPEGLHPLVKFCSPSREARRQRGAGQSCAGGPGGGPGLRCYSCCGSAQRWQHFTGGQRRAGIQWGHSFG